MKRTVLITGASRGIGREAAKAFAAAGYRVAINYFHSAAAAEEVKREIISSGGEAEVFRADVAEGVAAENMVREAEKRFGFIDTVVANAGVSLVKQINDTTEEEWNRLFAVNATGVNNVVRAALGGMISRKFGRIIAVSSVWGETGGSCEVAYSASKAAVIGYVKALAKELAPSGITVNCVSPGVIDTEMNARLSPSERAELESEIPAGRYGTAGEVAAAILFFASLDAGYITGEVLGVNGGFR